MRILIVSYVFPPFNSIGGVRVGKTAKYLLNHGHAVRVLTAQDQPFEPTLPLEIPAQNVIYTKWLNVRKPVEALSKETQAKSIYKELPDREVFSERLKRGARFAIRTFLYFPDANIGWFPYAVRAAARIMSEWRPDIILASSPPPSSLLVARHLSRKYGVPWVADLRDLWVDHQYYDQPKWRRAVEEKLERRVLSSAAGLVTVSEPLAETLKSKYAKDPAIVLNGFDPTDYPAHAEVPFNNGLVRIIYTGVVYEGRQDPSTLFRALRELGACASKVRVNFYGSFLQSVRELVARYEVESIVEVNGPVSYRESLKMQSEADILLLLLWTDRKHRGVYTGKLFEYIGARRPILAVGNAGDVAAELIQSRGLGLVMNDMNQIASQLQRWILQKQELGYIPSQTGQEVTGISREEQTRALESYLSRFLK